MTTKIVFHKADLDGVGSCMVVLKKLFKANVKDIKLIPWNYGEETPKFDNGDTVYIVDCSFPPEDMRELCDASLKGLLDVIWLDHHKSSYDDSYAHGYHMMEGVRNSHRPAAIEITWDFFTWHFFDNKKAPRGIELLSLYDTWQNSDKHLWDHAILPFQFGMRQRNWLKELMDSQDDTKKLKQVVDRFFYLCDDTDSTMELGDSILSYQKGLDEAAAQAAFPFVWKGVTFAAINGRGNSQLFDAVSFPYEACLLFRFNGKTMKWMFSLYGKDENEIDLSVLAKEMGGGGHKKACGFECAALADVFGPGAFEYFNP